MLLPMVVVVVVVVVACAAAAVVVDMQFGFLVAMNVHAPRPVVAGAVVVVLLLVVAIVGNTNGVVVVIFDSATVEDLQVESQLVDVEAPCCTGNGFVAVPAAAAAANCHRCNCKTKKNVEKHENLLIFLCK